MKDLLMNKKVMYVLLSLIFAGLSGAVGYNLKDEFCGCPKKEEVVVAPAAPVVAAPPAAVK
jgi:hypothetical protein